MNLIPVSGYGVGAYDRETIFEVLTACQELGLKAQAADERIGKANRDPEHRRELLEAVYTRHLFRNRLGDEHWKYYR